jgi:glycosyltransferase involved in cell wall biosynthesis
MAKADLLTAYRSVDCVVDQFILPCIGSVTLDAIALGVPVMTSLDNETMTKFYGEPLDLLNCSTVDEIADAMKLVIEGNPLVSELANKSQEWFERNHTATVLSDKLVSAIRVAMNNYERK